MAHLVPMRVSVRAEAKLKVKVAHLLLMLIEWSLFPFLLILLQPLLVLSQYDSVDLALSLR